MTFTIFSARHPEIEGTHQTLNDVGGELDSCDEAGDWHISSHRGGVWLVYSSRSTDPFALIIISSEEA